MAEAIHVGARKAETQPSAIGVPSSTAENIDAKIAALPLWSVGTGA
jgi:hypothetical protein